MKRESSVRPVILLASILAVVALTVAGSTIAVLYQTSFNQIRDRLVEHSLSLVTTFEAVTRYDAQSNIGDPDAAREATLSQIRAGHGESEEFGPESEMVIGELREDQIVFLLPRGNEISDSVPIEGELAAPMRAALRGESGSMVARDYEGCTVLAAFAPVPSLGIGVVTKISMEELRAPFVRASALAVAITIALALVGVSLFFRIGNPLLRTLEESESLYRTLFGNSKDAQLLITEGRIIECNGAASQLLGFPKDSILQRGLVDFSPTLQPGGKESSRMIHEINDAAMLGEVSVFSWTFQGQGGNEAEAEVSLTSIMRSRQLSFLLTARDVTERNRRAAETRMLAAAVDQASEGVIVTDGEGLIEYANPCFLETCGYSREELLGQTPRLLKSGHHPPQFYAKLWGEIRAGRSWTGVLVNRRKDGGLVHEETVISPIKDESGKVTRFISVQRDITRELELEAQLRHAQKLEAIGALAGGIAHDFNNQLTAILGFAEIALELSVPDDTAHEALQQVIRAGERASELTQQLLAFSRRQVLDPRVVDANEIINRSRSMLVRLLGEHVTLEVRLQASLERVKVDPGQLEQVIVNLAVNARDAMPNGGTLTIETYGGVFGAGSPHNTTGATGDRRVMICVKDTGEGMNAATLDRIFEPFFTTKSMGKGTGLGLSTVHGIVKQSGGTIEATSEEGVGTVFRVSLPIANKDDESVSLIETTPTLSPFADGGETILVVEDDDAVRELVRTSLVSLGYNVLLAEDGLQAIELAKSLEIPIDLLLSDVVMPRVSGPEAVREIQKIQPGIRVLYMSGYPEKVIAEHDVEGFGATYLPKPITPRILARRVREVLNENHRILHPE